MWDLHSRLPEFSLETGSKPSHISHPGFFHIRRGGLETGDVFMRALLVCYVKIPLQGFLASSLRKGAMQDHLESLTCVLWWGCLEGRAKDEGVSGTGKTPERRVEDWTWITPRPERRAEDWTWVTPREALLGAPGWLPRGAE